MINYWFDHYLFKERADNYAIDNLSEHGHTKWFWAFSSLLFQWNDFRSDLPFPLQKDVFLAAQVVDGLSLIHI